MSGIENRRPSATSSAIGVRSTNPSMRKLDGCTLRIAAGRLPDRQRVVGRARAVGRAHLAQPRARLGHHVGHPEPSADLHELCARDHHLAAARQRCQGQHRRGRAVVDDDGGLCAREPAEQRFGVRVARAASARREVVLEVRVSAASPAMRASAASPSGARPRLVWMITPVALMTRRSDGRMRDATSARRAPRSRPRSRRARRAPGSRQGVAHLGRGRAQRLHDRVVPVASDERPHARPLAS